MVNGKYCYFQKQTAKFYKSYKILDNKISYEIQSCEMNAIQLDRFTTFSASNLMVILT